MVFIAPPKKSRFYPIELNGDRSWPLDFMQTQRQSTPASTIHIRRESESAFYLRFFCCYWFFLHMRKHYFIYTSTDTHINKRIHTSTQTQTLTGARSQIIQIYCIILIISNLIYISRFSPAMNCCWCFVLVYRKPIVIVFTSAILFQSPENLFWKRQKGNGPRTTKFDLCIVYSRCIHK